MLYVGDVEVYNAFKAGEHMANERDLYPYTTVDGIVTTKETRTTAILGAPAVMAELRRLIPACGKGFEHVKIVMSLAHDTIAALESQRVDDYSTIADLKAKLKDQQQLETFGEQVKNNMQAKVNAACAEAAEEPRKNLQTPVDEAHERKAAEQERRAGIINDQLRERANRPAPGENPAK